MPLTHTDYPLPHRHRHTVTAEAHVLPASGGNFLFASSVGRTEILCEDTRFICELYVQKFTLVNLPRQLVGGKKNLWRIASLQRHLFHSSSVIPHFFIHISQYYLRKQMLIFMCASHSFCKTQCPLKPAISGQVTVD